MVTAWTTWSKELHNKRVLCFLDNMAALDILISGWSKSLDLNWMAGQSWLEVAKCHAAVTWQWVPSKLNPVDGLSRDDTTEWKPYARRALKWPKVPPYWSL